MDIFVLAIKFFFDFGFEFELRRFFDIIEPAVFRKLKMGLMTGQRTKSTNVVGQTMHLNPHGDDPIYQTLVRLTRGNDSLLYPFID